MPAYTSSFPSDPPRTATLSPEPSRTVTPPRRRCATIGAFAASDLIFSTMPCASAKACRGVSQRPAAANVGAERQQRQKPRREGECRRLLVTAVSCRGQGFRRLGSEALLRQARV